MRKNNFTIMRKILFTLVEEQDGSHTEELEHFLANLAKPITHMRPDPRKTQRVG